MPVIYVLNAMVWELKWFITMFMVDHTKAPWAGMIFEGIPNKPYKLGKI